MTSRWRYSIPGPGWVWLYCDRPHPPCGHAQPVALVPYAIRWGLRDMVEITAALRANARCAACGWRGASTIVPSWRDHDLGTAPFPTGRVTAAAAAPCGIRPGPGARQTS